MNTNGTYFHEVNNVLDNLEYFTEYTCWLLINLDDRFSKDTDLEHKAEQIVLTWFNEEREE